MINNIFLCTNFGRKSPKSMTKIMKNTNAPPSPSPSSQGSSLLQASATALSASSPRNDNLQSMVKIRCPLSSKYIKKRIWWPINKRSLFKFVFQNQTIVIHRSESIWCRGKGGVSHRKNTIKAGGSTARAQNVWVGDGWMDGWMDTPETVTTTRAPTVLKMNWKSDQMSTFPVDGEIASCLELFSRLLTVLIIALPLLFTSTRAVSIPPNVASKSSFDKRGWQDNKEQRTRSKRGFNSKDDFIRKMFLTKANNFKRGLQQRVTCSLMLINITTDKFS